MTCDACGREKCGQADAAGERIVCLRLGLARERAARERAEKEIARLRDAAEAQGRLRENAEAARTHFQQRAVEAEKQRDFARSLRAGHPSMCCGQCSDMLAAAEARAAKAEQEREEVRRDRDFEKKERDRDWLQKISEIEKRRAAEARADRLRTALEGLAAWGEQAIANQSSCGDSGAECPMQDACNDDDLAGLVKAAREGAAAVTRTPADFADGECPVCCAAIRHLRAEVPSCGVCGWRPFDVAMARMCNRAQVLAISISDDHDAALRWAKRWKHAAKLGYSFEAERARVAAARAECATSPLRDAVALTIGRLRGAADQLERALEQEGRG